MSKELVPRVKEFLDQLANEGYPPTSSLSVEGARRVFQEKFVEQEKEPVEKIRDLMIPGPSEDISIRVYIPGLEGPYPVLAYFHGGGWVLGDIESQDAVCRTLTNRVDCVVVSVDYRLAPENQFPAAVEDTYASIKWLSRNGGFIFGDPNSIAVAGDSAGGNLAASTSLMARNREGPEIAHQVLIYPATDCSFDTKSYKENSEGYFLTRNSAKWFWNHYLRYDTDALNPYASPLQCKDLSALPSATIITAEFDPLRDEGRKYADRLEEAGIRVNYKNYEGVIHGFLRLFPGLEPREKALDEIVNDLGESFGRD